MNITSSEDINGGGNCMLTELLVEGGGDLASITITEEFIVGRKIPFSLDNGEADYDEVVLWAVMDVESIKFIPKEIKAQVLQAYQVYRKKYNRSMDITGTLTEEEERFSLLLDTHVVNGNGIMFDPKVDSYAESKARELKAFADEKDILCYLVHDERRRWLITKIPPKVQPKGIIVNYHVIGENV